MGAKSAGTGAKRGDVALVPVEYSYTSLREGTHRRRAFQLGIVTSVTRDGLVRATAWYEDGCESAGAVFPRAWRADPARRGGHVPGCLVVARSRFRAEPAHILERIPCEYATAEQARDALRPFLLAAAESRVAA